MKKLNFLMFLLFTVSGLLISTFAEAQGRIYVNGSNNSTDNDGSSWAKAITSLSEALEMASDSSAITEIWVAQGTYSPDLEIASEDATGAATTTRDYAFVMVPNVKIYGGFNATESNLNARKDTTGTSTILSGDINTANDSTDNCYHVVIASGELGTASLNGFTITGGNANGANSIYVNSVSVRPDNGAGIYDNTSVSLNNLIISNNNASTSGGGMYDTRSDDETFSTLTNITITNNTAEFGGGLYINSSPSVFNNVTFSLNKADNGGGIYINHGAIPTFNNVTFSDNSASIQGGGLCNSESYPILNQVSFSGNSSTNYGGGICNMDNSTMMLYNTVMSKNSSSKGGGIYCTASTATIYNSIISGNSATSESTGGGGLYNNGSNVTMYNVVLSGNLAASGAALFNSRNSNDSLYNVTISGNIAENGGAMYNYGNTTLTIYNSIIWGNDSTSADKSIVNYDNTAISTYYYSMIEGAGSSNSWNTDFGTDGGNNIDSEDSPFVNWINPSSLDSIATTDGDYHLNSSNGCIDAGNNTYALTNYDLDGNARIYNNITVDMGAYESSYTGEETGISSDIKTNSFTIYPTLATDYIYIESDQIEEPFVKVYSLVGQLMYNGNTNKINVSGFENGIYIIQIEGKTYKFLKK